MLIIGSASSWPHSRSPSPEMGFACKACRDGHYRCSKEQPTCKSCRLRETACIYTSSETEPQQSCKACHDANCGSCDTREIDDHIEQQQPAERFVIACTSDQSVSLTTFSAANLATPVARMTCITTDTQDGKGSTRSAKPATKSTTGSDVDRLLAKLPGHTLASAVDWILLRVAKAEERNTHLSNEIERLKASNAQKDAQSKSLHVSLEGLEERMNTFAEGVHGCEDQGREVIKHDQLNVLEQRVLKNETRVEEVASRDRMGNYWHSYENRISELEWSGKKVRDRVKEAETRLEEHTHQAKIDHAEERDSIFTSFQRIEEKCEQYDEQLANIGAVIKLPEARDRATPTPRQAGIALPFSTKGSGSATVTPQKVGGGFTDPFTSHTPSPLSRSTTDTTPFPRHRSLSRTGANPYNALDANSMKRLTSSAGGRKRGSSPTDISPVPKRTSSTLGAGTMEAQRPALTRDTQNLPNDQQSRPVWARRAGSADPVLSQANSASTNTMFGAAPPKISQIPRNAVTASAIVSNPFPATPKAGTHVGSPAASKSTRKPAWKAPTPSLDTPGNPSTSKSGSQSGSAIQRGSPGMFTPAPTITPSGPSKNSVANNASSRHRDNAESFSANLITPTGSGQKLGDSAARSPANTSPAVAKSATNTTTTKNAVPPKPSGNGHSLPPRPAVASSMAPQPSPRKTATGISTSTLSPAPSLTPRQVTPSKRTDASAHQRVQGTPTRTPTGSGGVGGSGPDTTEKPVGKIFVRQYLIKQADNAKRRSEGSGL